QAGLMLTDSSLAFGLTKMIHGRAFLLGTNADDGQVMVAKDWMTLNGRKILLEEVPVQALADQLATLPLVPEVATKARKNLSGYAASGERHLPPQRLANLNRQGPRLAKGSVPERGIVLDYQTVSGTVNGMTFQGDTTYFISDTLYLTGTNSFEGGAVIKFPTNDSVQIQIDDSATVNWLASTYHPIVFTAKDD